MSLEVRVVPNRYVDSVRLMQVATDVRGRDGVRSCEVLMGTPANLRQLDVSVSAGPTDVVIAVDADAAGDALDAAERALSTSPGGRGQPAPEPRSLASAARALDDVNIALISVPGEYAVLEAHRALSEGLHVFLFSDHVSTADEVALKRRGADRGLLVMGPECGTAMLGGVGLGFANVLRSGPVGIVAAAGTGAQEAGVLLDREAVGVSQIVGLGGRDLSAEVGGIMCRLAMELLADDAGTETLLLVSKPPAPEVVRELADVDVGGRRVVAAFVGWDGGAAPFEVHSTLEAGALAAAGASTADDPEAPAGEGPVLGLFSGGSLAHEAQTILGPGHRILDLGDERYTQGRPHPMVDLDVRLGLLREEGPAAGCVLLDVVIGHGSHADPAGALAGTLADLACPVIAHVCGTPGDPQDSRRQEATLREAGVHVAPTNAAAARMAARVAA
jgi:FdrA protein